MKKAGRIYCPAPLPEELAGPLLTKMLVPAPYKAPKKKAEKEAKKTRGGLHRRGTMDTKSKDSNAHSSFEEDGEEEDKSPAGGKNKRMASSSLEADRTLEPLDICVRSAAATKAAPGLFGLPLGLLLRRLVRCRD